MRSWSSGGEKVREFSQAADVTIAATPSITVPATSVSGARVADSAVLAGFLFPPPDGEEGHPSGRRLAALIDGVPVTPATTFPLGQTIVTFRTERAGEAVGQIRSLVTVVAGTPEIHVRAASSGRLTGTQRYINLHVSNEGSGNAPEVAFDLMLASVTRGSGVITVSAPRVPLGLGRLDAGAMTRVRVVLDVPATVQELSLLIAGHCGTVQRALRAFVQQQTIVP
jgi:hypothetical protein